MVYDHQSKSSSWTPTPRKSSFFPPSHIQTKTEATKGSELVGNLPSKAQRDKIRRSLFGDIPQMTGAKAETASQEAKAVENPTQVSEEADSGEIQAKAETGLSQSQGYGVPSREVRNKIRRSLFGNLEQTPVQKQEEGTSPPTSILQGEGSMDDARGEAKGLAETEITLPIQAKLTIGEPNDKYEQEADRVARQVVDKIHSPTPETVQRQEIGDEDEVSLKSEAGSGGKVEAGVGVTGVRMSPIEGVRVNRKVNSEGETQEASAQLEASIQGKRGSGQPLDESVREPMEREFGADFSGVRVHTDGKADELNQAIQAKAFTTGEDIFFREGAYEPGSKGGQELLAHELTHVVQQGKGKGEEGKQRKTASSSVYDARVVQRMVTPYTLKEIGVDDNESKFADETIAFLRWQRPAISNDVKKAVDNFGDGQNNGTYKHYMPWDWIAKGLNDHHISMKTRRQVFDQMKRNLDFLEIESSTTFNPTKNKIEFDLWLEEAFEKICDWPQNIFRWNPSSGDGGGTSVDHPQADITNRPSLKLINRLELAYNKLSLVLQISKPTN